MIAERFDLLSIIYPLLSIPKLPVYKPLSKFPFGFIFTAMTAMSRAQYRVCFKCKWEGETAETLCPRCHKPTKTRNFIRGTGAALIGLGGFLLALMSVITVAVIGVIQQSNKPGTGARYTGTKGQMIFMFCIFGAVLLFGLASLAAGLWQVIFGRRNMILVYVILILGTVFVIGGSSFTLFFGD